MNSLREYAQKRILDARTNPRAVAVKMNEIGATLSPPVRVGETYVRSITLGRIKDAGKSKMELFEQAIVALSSDKIPINKMIDERSRQDNQSTRFDRKVEIPVFASTGIEPFNPLKPLEVSADLGANWALEIDNRRMDNAARVGDKAVCAPYPRPIKEDHIVVVEKFKDGTVSRLMWELTKETDGRISVRQYSPLMEKEFDRSKIDYYKVVDIKKR